MRSTDATSVLSRPLDLGHFFAPSVLTIPIYLTNLMDESSATAFYWSVAFRSIENSTKRLPPNKITLSSGKKVSGKNVFRLILTFPAFFSRDVKIKVVAGDFLNEKFLWTFSQVKFNSQLTLVCCRIENETLKWTLNGCNDGYLILQGSLSWLW